MTSVACARAAPITSMIWVDFDGCVVRACVFWGATADRLGGLEAICFASLCLDALSCLIIEFGFFVVGRTAMLVGAFGA